MEESKEIQGFYKIFRTIIYVSVVMEFFEYAFTRGLLYNWGTVVIDIHDRIQTWFIYHPGNLIWSKLATFVIVCITCIGTRNKKHPEFNLKKQVIYPLLGGIAITVLSVFLFWLNWGTTFCTITFTVWMYFLATIIGTAVVSILSS